MDYINVAIAISDSFMMPAQVMLHSLCRQSSRPISLFLLYNALSSENRAKLKKEVEGFSGKFQEILIDESYFKNASLDNNPLYSIEIYYSVLLPYITNMEKMLWLDADIIVNGDIAELYDKDISEHYLAAITDSVEENGGREEIKKTMQMAERTYFNSGVLLLNNQRIREEIPQERFFITIEKYNVILKCPDQDILNKVLGEKCLILPIRYNYQHHTTPGCKPEDALILHYIWKKPWNADYPGYLDEPFWNEAVSCGFNKEYKKYKRQRKMNFYKNELIPAAISKIKRKK
jgi:lipopolysaccharide biosynthesis glycosyltransferase